MAHSLYAQRKTSNLPNSTITQRWKQLTYATDLFLSLDALFRESQSKLEDCKGLRTLKIDFILSKFMGDKSTAANRLIPLYRGATVISSFQ